MKKENTTLKSLVSAGLCNVDFDDESNYIPIYHGGFGNDHDTTYMRAIDVLSEYGDLPIYPINIHDGYYKNVLDKLDSTRIVADLYLTIDDFTWYASSQVDSDPRFVFGLW
jgi:hypothetical protein